MVKNRPCPIRCLLCGILCLLFISILPGSHSWSDTSRPDPVAESSEALQLRPVPPLVRPSGVVNNLLNPGSRNRAAGSSRWANAATRASAAMPFAPSLTATKVDALVGDDGDGNAEPGEGIMYTVTISNGGPDPATNVNFTDTIDANTTFVPGSLAASPIAVNDSYQTIGNVQIQVPAAAGLLANDINPNGPASQLVITGNTTPANGTVTINNTDGSFTYTPNAGFRGPDSFTYTLGNTTGKTDTATVTITFNGMIWFVNSAAATNGDGRLISPFNCLVGTGCFDPAATDAANDNIFLYSSATNYTGGLTLLSGQKLIGQGASQSILAITALPAPSGANLLPATGMANPTVVTALASTNAVNLGTNNDIWGITFGNTTGADIRGTAVGTFKVRDTTLNGNGQALEITTSGTLDAIFQSISSTNSAATAISVTGVSGSLSSPTTTITNPTGMGINLQTSSASFNFGTTAITQSSNTGVNLGSNTGAISFGDLDITPDSAVRGMHATSNTGVITTTSGTIVTVNNTAVEITGVSAASRTPLNMTLTQTSATGAPPNGVALTNVNGPTTNVGFIVNGGSSTALGGDASGGTISGTTGADGATTGNGIFLSSADEVTFRRITVNGTNSNHGIRGINASNFTLEFSTVSGTNGNSAALDEGSVNFDNLTTAAAITSCLIDGGFEDNLNVVNTSGTLNRLVISSTTFGFNSTANGNNNILIESQNPGTTLNYTLQNSIVRGARADWLNAQPAAGGTLGMIVTGNTFSNIGADLHPGAVANGNRILLQANGTSTFDIDTNLIRGSFGSAVATNSLAPTASMVGEITNNDIGITATADSGSRAGSGISIQSTAGGDVNVLIDGNDIRQYNNHGILFTLGDQMGTPPTISATVSNNTVNTPGTLLNNFNGFHVNSGTVSTDSFTSCINISNNNFTGGGKGAAPPNSNDVRLQQRQGTTIQLPGYTGPAKDLGDGDNDAVVTYLRPAGSGGVKNNQFVLGAANNASTGGGYVNSLGGAPCSVPSLMSLLTEEQAALREEKDRAVPVYRDILFAPEGVNAGSGAGRLREFELLAIVQASLARWQQLGVSSDDLERLKAVEFEIADLPDDQLAVTTPTRIIIDETAAGYEWFIDSTPEENTEFRKDATREFRAKDDSYASERMDLLTAVTRGLDYVLEHKWWSRSINRLGLMEQTLPPSVRRVALGPVNEPRPLPEPIDPSSTGTVPGVSQSDTPVKGGFQLSATETLVAQSPSTRPGATEESNQPVSQSGNSGARVLSDARYAVFNPLADPSLASALPASLKVNSAAAGSSRTVPVSFTTMSGETVTLGPFTLPAGESVMIMFNVTIDNPLPAAVCSVSNQGTITADGGISILTDDPDVAGTNQPTVTQIVTVPTITCPANITTNTDPGVCTAVETFAPTVTGCPVPTVVCTPASGFAFPKGVTTVTCSATNTAGSVNCTFTVTVNDNEPPTITCPANVTVSTDPGVCTAVVNYTVPPAMDNCPGATVACVPNTGSTFPKGVTTVTCTVTDAVSLTANCTFTVTVNDTQPPTITCPANITTPATTGQCSAIVTYTAPTVSDNCPGVGTPVCSPASGASFPVGTTTVTCNVSDAAVPPNTAMCTFTVTVNDTQPPTITCPADITVSSNVPAPVTYTTPTPSDNCPGATASCVPASGSTFPVGTTTVTCTATDASSNTATCTFTVSLIPCTVTCPANITQPAAAGQCNAVVTYPPPTTTGTCGTVTCAPASGSTFTVGTTTVTCTASAGPSCMFTVTVTDTQPPTITCPADISMFGNSPAPVTYTTPTPTDNCPGATAACVPPSGSTFPVGTTTVTCTATDASGNTANCTFTITLVPCTITCPSNITQPAAAGQCSAAVTYPAPTTTGTCGTVTCSPVSGSTFPVGTTTVTCTTAASPSCSFTVTVTDTQPPTITCPANVSVSSNVPIAVNYPPPTASDNCPGVTASCVPASGSTFPVGTTTVTCTATDASTNTATCTFTVSVIPCTITCPANITQGNDTGLCSAVVTYADPTTTGMCGTVTCVPASGSTFPVGTTTVTCSTTAGPSCMFTVTVNDTQNPVITCPANITQANDPGQCSAVVTFMATATDNCAGVGTPVCSPASGSTFPAGTTTVNCSVSDAAGNTANCSFTVTVNDTQPPTITCPANVTVPAGAGQCSAVVSYPAPTVSDNCPGVGSPTCSPASGSTFPRGTTTVTCTVTDASKNTSNCSFTVTVNDTQPPMITCPANITTSNNANQCSAVVSFTVNATDNCPGVTVVANPPSGSTFPVGVTTVTATATDTSGNTATCSFTVTVMDTQAPVIVCPSNVVVVPPTMGMPCAVATYPAPVVTDNCPGATFVCTPASGSCFPVGVTTVTCTATDAAGNTSACSFNVTTFDLCVQDDSDPTRVVLVNTTTGQYRFCCGGNAYTGMGTVTIKGNIVTVQHNNTNRRVLIKVDRGINQGTASLQTPPGTMLCSIRDTNLNNNSCVCQ
jgi:hypothetical protein